MMSIFLRITGTIFLIISFIGIFGSNYVNDKIYFAIIALIGFVNLGFSKLIYIFENKNNKNKKRGIVGYFLGD